MTSYSINTYVFKTIHSLKVKADVFIPNEASMLSHRPVCLYFHGGGMVVGNRKSFLPPWLIDSCVSRGWLFVSADYRLAPETKGVELLSDLSDAWNWVIGGGLESELVSSGIKVDPKKSFVAGSSAGGYCAYIVSAAASIKPACVINCYGMYEPLSPTYTQPHPDDEIIGIGWLDIAEVKEYLQEGRPEISDLPITGVNITGRALLFHALVLNGLWAKYVLGVSDVNNLPPGVDKMVPSLAIQKDFPPIVILHGTSDTAVKLEESLRAKEKFDQLGVECSLILVEGQEHGFDGVVNADPLNSTWSKHLSHIIEFVEKYVL
ncbi:hypothetical protein K7432_005162 [Basidiobolus ranarum]|uniref:Alpha/beta hydrolase fold-3 domain-containing protein n=1 Tax=Basidiobolus ranarum TaxID=34480 RepID=A0ABR2WX35_9FUNG